MADLLEFPRYVDDPPTLLQWRIDDLIPVVVFGSIAILTDQPLLILVGHLLVRLCARTTPNPFIRTWLP
jgi:conjugal transfer pilus assembly protein TraL